MNDRGQKCQREHQQRPIAQQFIANIAERRQPTSLEPPRGQHAGNHDQNGGQHRSGDHL
jgi:hypothetical protein